jgi:hypothetical protein
MEDFKKSSKMQCFKEGGSVKYKSRHSEKSEMSSDISQDKKVVKKAFAMHDKQEHPGKKTNLSKLKNGGRAKKDCGTVRKYKTGGTVENAYGAKKTDKDIKDIANTKRQKPKKMAFGGLANAVVNSAKNTVNNMPKPSQPQTPTRSGGIMGGATNAVNRAVSNIPKPAAITKPLIGGMMGKPAMPFRKKGGKVKKMNTGGTCS